MVEDDNNKENEFQKKIDMEINNVARQAEQIYNEGHQKMAMEVVQPQDKNAAVPQLCEKLCENSLGERRTVTCLQF